MLILKTWKDNTGSEVISLQEAIEQVKMNYNLTDGQIFEVFNSGGSIETMFSWYEVNNDLNEN